MSDDDLIAQLETLLAQADARAAAFAASAEDAQRKARDPLHWVETIFPWGGGGTSLEREGGPDEWQAEILGAIRDGLLNIAEAIQIAVASGHGIGKSCLVAWIILWALTTKTDTRGVVTANTDIQLRTKTWAELGKWFQMMPGREAFSMTATAIYARSAPLTWRIDAIAWSEERPEAFAGLHNAGKRVLLVFDEASTIANIIWETAQGALTDLDTELIWVAFGNPTRNTGRFKECFGRFRHRWLTRQIDSRLAKKTNKTEISKLVEDYGEDHDIVRVRVRGIFPRAGSMQFIPSDLVETAQARIAGVHNPPMSDWDAVIMGVDIARSLEGDETVIWIRRGRDARSIPRTRLRVRDTMVIAARVADLARQYAVDAIFVDGGGVGGGVVDRLHQLRQPVIEVQFGGEPTNALQSASSGIHYFNRRAEMWGSMRDWLAGGYLPADPDIAADLTGPEYGYKQRGGQDAILLEKKEDMKKRGLASPDSADALALTFALPVQPSDHSERRLAPTARAADYDPYRDFER